MYIINSFNKQEMATEKGIMNWINIKKLDLAFNNVKPKDWNFVLD